MLTYGAQFAPPDRLLPSRRIFARLIRPAFARMAVAFLGLTIGLGVAAGDAGAKTHMRHGAHGRLHRVYGAAAPVAGHVETWAYDDGCNGGVGARSGLVRTWLSFAESNCGPNATKASSDCHASGHVYCEVMQYLDTDWAFGEDHVPMAGADSSSAWWLHTPSSQAFATIFTSSLGGGYLMNQSSPAVRSFFRSYVRAYYNSDDGLLMDWQSPSLAQELYYSSCGCTSTLEIPSNALLQAAHQTMAAALTHRDGTPFIQADSSLPVNPDLPQGLDMINPAIGVDAWVAEGEPMEDGTLDAYYSTLLDQMAYIASRTSGFVVLLSRGSAGAAYQRRSRRVQEATVLLGFRPGHVVDWADLEDGSGNLAAWPEEGIYPTAPVQSMAAPAGRGCLAGTGVACSRGGHNSVEVAPGVYRRVFRACYSRGVRFGACAVVVNTTGRQVVVRAAWLRGVTVRHRIRFVGGDVQSGGHIDLNGAPFRAGSTTVGPDDALLLAN